MRKSNVYCLHIKYITLALSGEVKAKCTQQIKIILEVKSLCKVAM